LGKPPYYSRGAVQLAHFQHPEGFFMAFFLFLLHFYKN